MTNKENPAVQAILGLLMLAKKEGRVAEIPVRGITEIGINVDHLTREHWRAILSRTPSGVREVFAGLCDIPAKNRVEYAELLRRIQAPDSGYERGAWDPTQSFIDLLHAQDGTLQTVSEVIQREYLREGLGKSNEY